MTFKKKFKEFLQKRLNDSKFIRERFIENNRFTKRYLLKKKEVYANRMKEIFNEIKYRDWWVYRFKLFTRFARLEFFKKSSYSRFVIVAKGASIAGLGFFLLLIMILKEADMSDYIDLDIPENSPNEEFVFNVKGLEITGFDAKDRFVTLRSAEGEEEVKGSKMYFKGMEAVVRSTFTNEWMIFKGENTVYDKNSKEIELKGSFSIENHDKWFMSGNNGFLDLNTMIGTSNDFVTVETDMGKLKAEEGFYIEPNKVYKFKGRVNLIFDEKALPEN
jgi:hypothetical protein